jgi:6-pyruvoyltetrahydropterin/6-carboxytetrahydropterin synthase
MAKYRSTKTYGHELGLSCCFRQWRADSHCNQLHGYSLAFQVVFEADTLDARNWVVDFGSLKSFKAILEDSFDHKLVVAQDDPELGFILQLKERGIADVLVFPRVGCEAFAEYVGETLDIWLTDNGYAPRVRVVSVECREHGANSALWVA